MSIIRIKLTKCPSCWGRVDATSGQTDEIAEILVCPHCTEVAVLQEGSFVRLTREQVSKLPSKVLTCYVSTRLYLRIGHGLTFYKSPTYN